ncbi:3657_t:CDS:1, partial [Funneliformis caledonium]
GKNYSIISVTADFNVARRRFWNTRKYCIDDLLMGAKKKLDQSDFNTLKGSALIIYIAECRQLI